MENFTEEQLIKMVEYKMSRPIPLDEGNLKKSFLYDRKYGFFYIQGGNHQLAMGLLYAWHKGFSDVYEMLENVEHKELFSKISLFGRNEAIADMYLSTIEGTCFSSSCSKKILVEKESHLNEYEHEIFEGRLTYMD